jgi:hypothetical protein
VRSLALEQLLGWPVRVVRADGSEIAGTVADVTASGARITTDQGEQIHIERPADGRPLTPTPREAIAAVLRRFDVARRAKVDHVSLKLGGVMEKRLRAAMENRDNQCAELLSALEAVPLYPGDYAEADEDPTHWLHAVERALAQARGEA